MVVSFSAFCELETLQTPQLTEGDLIPFQLSPELPGQWDWMLGAVCSPIIPSCSGTQSCWTGWFFRLISPRGEREEMLLLAPTSFLIQVSVVAVSA